MNPAGGAPGNAAESVFDHYERTDARPARAGEGRFEFLNRSASNYFATTRELIDNWFSHIPTEHQAGLRGALRSDSASFDSAFWELYLHEGYRRSGYQIEIHPTIPGVTTHPDFLVEHDHGTFYLEAVSVGRHPGRVAEDRRLDTVHRVLTNMKITGFTLNMSTYSTGPAPLATRKLRRDLKAWLDSLDPEAVSQDAASSNRLGFDRVPELLWHSDGWNLEFHAIPLKAEARHQPRSALGMMGMGEAVGVDNETGLRRVLRTKRNRYGHLDAPLVIAVQSSTDFPTRDYEMDNALYGSHNYRPTNRRAGVGHLFEEGLWYGTHGWQNAHVPQVISVYDLAPWTVTRTRARHWSTLEPGVQAPSQPSWIAPMIVGPTAEPGAGSDLATHFGLPPDWPAPGDPDFDLTND